MTLSLLNGQPMYCDAATPNACPAGSTCEQATTTSTPANVCCQSGQSIQPQCPRGLTLQMGTDNRPIYCNPGTCASPSTCERATNMPRDVCCRDDNVPGTNQCPTGYRPQRASSGQTSTCDPTIFEPCTNYGFCLPTVTGIIEIH